MKKKFQLFTFLILMLLSGSLFAQRPMEKLDRSAIAQKVSNGIYVNWRIPSDEWYNTYYKLYRDGNLIFTTTTTGASNYLDVSGTIASKYSVSCVRNGVESPQCAQVAVLTKNYLEIPMRDIKSLGKKGYYLNDATAADLDGDGQYEIIIKRMNHDWTTTNTNYTYFEAYKLDGTFMWAIDVGPNITMDVEINIAAFDLDGDGKAEVFMRSSDNTVFGLDINNQNGTSVGDRDGDGQTNYRSSIGGDGFMNAGPEYLSLIDGQTGKEIDWVNFIPRGSSSDWGDDYGHRANKFFFGAPYLDGKHPSLFIGRGIYTQTKMRTYDVINKKLVVRWTWESGNSAYAYQGNHNFTIADTDGDGKDEIVWGSMCIDDNGTGLYTTGLGHGDAIHVGDFDPYRKGTEVFACNEANPGTNFRDGKTGQILYRHVTAKDCGRCCAANISDSFKGVELWGGGIGMSATDRTAIANFGLAENYAIYWDGDLLQEILDHSGFSTSTGVGYGAITKFNGYGNISTLLSADAYSCNYTKGTPCLQADLVGDWREEAIWWRADSMALRMYISPYPTTNRIYTLMHDHQYRQAICWQMCGYNQPPHTSFYLGADFPTPIPAKSTNGKLLWKGTSSNLDTTTPNFMNGDDAAGLIAGTSSALPFSTGKSILLDGHGVSKDINLTVDVQPELLMISGSDNYSLGGTGVLSGNMILDKMGEGSFTLSGTHNYTGVSNVWEGNLWLNGSITASPLTVRRHANLGGKATLGNGLTTEYNAGIYVGGQNVADTMKISGTLNLVTGAKLVYDLSDNPTLVAEPRTASSLKNDYLQLNGTLQLGTGAVFVINQLADSLTVGKYLLMKTDSISGSLTSVKIQGTGGKSVELTYDTATKELFLVVKGTRSASKITWTGRADSNWNLAKTANWSNDGFADIFVSNDSVYFDETGINRSITIADSLAVSNVEVNSSLSYTFGGVGGLIGSMGLKKSGIGNLFINTRNNYTGKTVIDGGSLVMKYAPSTTNNGGIGRNIADPSYLVLKDSACLQVTTANEITSRGLTIAGEAGGLLNVSAGLYWNGSIQGTKLTKFGSGTLFIGSDNASLAETVLKVGTIKLNSVASVSNGVGKKITLLGGTLETMNSSGAYTSSNHAIDVPTGCTATLIAGARCDYNGVLTGGGTLNWSCDFIRAYINGNWSAFSGTLNIAANSANSTYENHFIVNNSGFPNATISLGAGVLMCYKNGTSDNGTSTIKIGMLTGAGNCYNAGLEVGSLSTNGTFSGIISGSTSVKKVGTGIWYLTGANTYTGTTAVSAGTLTLSGSLATGTTTIGSDALMNLYGTTGGSVIVSPGGTLSLTGKVNGLVTNNGTLKGTGSIVGNSTLANNSLTLPGNTSIGTMTFGGNLSMGASASLDIQLSGTNSSDKLVVTGTLACNGLLDVSMLAVNPVAGNSYQIISASTITGTFNTVNLPELDAASEWDLSELYTTGTIKVKVKTALSNPTLSINLKQNPSSGIFELITGNVLLNVDIITTDLQGKTVLRKKLSQIQSNEKIDLRGLPEGIYLMKIRSNDYSETFKLIKKNNNSL